jgi:threonine/homoserine/homoserine lactone efflux protein
VTAHLAAFVGLVCVIVAILGPSVMLVVKSTMLRGRRAAVLVAIGVLCGDALWAVAAAGGITAVIVASRPAFEGLRLAGAVYLVYLGLRLLLAREVRLDSREPSAVSGGRRSRRGILEGLLCEVSNPKSLIVFTSVIPQFLSSKPAAGEVALFGSLFGVLRFVSLSIYAVVLGATRRVARRRLPNLLLRGSGGLLVAFGVDLVVDRSA